MPAKSSLHCLLLYLLFKDRLLWAYSSGLKPWAEDITAANWEDEFCGMKELEPPSHSIQDILDGVSLSTSAELTMGSRERTLPPSYTHGVPAMWQTEETNPAGHGSLSCGISELIQTNMQTWLLMQGREPGLEEGKSRISILATDHSWMGLNTTWSCSLKNSSHWNYFDTDTLDSQLKLGGIHIFLCSTISFCQHEILQVVSGMTLMKG